MQLAPTAPETHHEQELLRQLLWEVMDSQGDCARAAINKHNATKMRSIVFLFRYFSFKRTFWPYDEL